MDEFFAYLRAALGPLKQSQVDGINTLVAASAGLSIRDRAYILATAWHETAATMQPIAEYGKGKGKPYGVVDATGKAPYGRGYVQLTWRANYVKADSKLGLGGTLAANYDRALEPAIAAKIIVQGMVNGWFTKKRLSDFTNYVDMRSIVNGSDRALLIAGYAQTFEGALFRIKQAPAPQPPKIEPPPVPPAPLGWWARLLSYFRA